MPGWLSPSLRARRHKSSSVICRAGRRQLAADLLGWRTASTYWVASGGKAGAPDTSCQSAGYASIQAAVNAAEAAPASHYSFTAPTIEICPGTYTEQVTITKSMTLTRAAGSPYGGPVTIELPVKIADSTTNCQAKDGSIGTQTVIEVCAAGPGGVNTSGTQVTIRDVTVEGDWTTEPDCNENRYDIYVAGGASLSLTGSTVEKAGLAIPLSGACQVDYGVEVGWQLSGQVGHADITGDTIDSYQKNGITVDGPGSTADIDHDVITGSGPTPIIAQNGIQISFGAMAVVTENSISGNNYTGGKGASSAGILAFGGGGSVCGNGTVSPLVKGARFISNRLVGNDVGILLANYDPTCTKSVTTPTGDVACLNFIQNSNGKASADANTTGYAISPAVGYQAGVSDAGDQDVICDNAIYGAGYAPLGPTSSLPNPQPPAFVRPVDIVSGGGTGPAIDPVVYGNSFDGFPYYRA